METFWDFFSFTDANVRYVTFGAILVTSSAAIVGCFTFLRKKALVGDAVAHAVLPGVCLGFILSGVKDPLWIIIGAFITGWLSLLLMDQIISKSRIKEDSAIAFILSTFFGLGILLLTWIQKSGNAAQSGLDQFLFGKAAALVGNDLIVFSVVAIILIVLVVLFFKEFQLLAFNKDFAQSMGLPIKLIEFISTSMTVLAVVAGIQAVGVVLMAAMLITPPAAARYWTNNLQKMLLLAAVFGGFSGLAGAYISYLAPSMPTGPWIVVVVSLIAFFSFFFAPEKGIIPLARLQKRNQQKITDENILKGLYHLREDEKHLKQKFTFDELLEKRPMHKDRFHKSIKRLSRKSFIILDNHSLDLSESGLVVAKRVVKLHRLWELYLSEFLNKTPDQVHDEAETIEHLITPELERQLEVRLNFPNKDPHDEDIPY